MATGAVAEAGSGPAATGRAFAPAAVPPPRRVSVTRVRTTAIPAITRGPHPLVQEQGARRDRHHRQRTADRRRARLPGAARESAPPQPAALTTFVRALGEAADASGPRGTAPGTGATP
ncbi:hypothetical protein [Streptomyces sp. NPDC057438]|uniref:hypothetical protein n=1 Tax=Streptomyces sp. NPDC057438 TaxID=3346133 RepID=UPI0036B16487